MKSEIYYFRSRKCNWKFRLPKWRSFCPGDGVGYWWVNQHKWWPQSCSITHRESCNHKAPAAQQSSRIRICLYCLVGLDQHGSRSTAKLRAKSDLWHETKKPGGDSGLSCWCIWHIIPGLEYPVIIVKPQQLNVNWPCCTQFRYMKVYAVETLHSTIYYSKYFIELNIDKSTQYVAFWTHKRHPIPRPFGRAMECLLWVLQQKLIVL